MDLMPPAGEGGVADHGVATSMQVIVKAANQKYNDQTIECQGSWTVKKLKAHLAEVYPCKPRENQQKIIFSGRLLQDHLVLKDVLRSFDPNCPTTVHLVCAPGVESKESSPAPDASASASASTNTSGVRRRTVPASRASTVAEAPSQPTEASATLPQHQVPSSNAQSPPNTQYPSNWNAEAYAAWLQQYFNQAQHQRANVDVGTGGDYQNMYQQYWQYYMYMQYAQYMQAAQGGSGFPDAIGTGQAAVPATDAENVPAAAAAVGGAANADNAGANAAAAAPAGLGAAGGGGAMFEDEEEEGRNRDWLDWLYVGSRLGVLLSIIYFYSTVGRFMLVFGFCFLLYILRNHLYANRNNNNRNRRNNNNAANGNAAAAAAAPAANNAPAAGAAAVAEPGPDPVAPGEAPADAPGQEEGARGEGVQNEANDDNAPGAAPQPDGPSAWSVVVTIITTFFSSLVPQPPPAN